MRWRKVSSSMREKHGAGRKREKERVIFMYTFDGRIRYSETDSEGKLTMASLLNYFQDSSTFHSEDVGLGVEYFKTVHQVWVLSSWQIVVERYPRLCERVVIGTQPYDMKGFLGYRNFAMTAENGEYLAKANSIWSLLDLDKGKPVPVSDEMARRYGLGDRLEMEYAPRKIAVPEGGVSGEAIVVKQHHLDTNHHVNNGQFVDMAMDFLPERFVIRQLRAEYKKQAFLDDVLMPYIVTAEDRIVVSLTDEKRSPYVVVEFSGSDETGSIATCGNCNGKEPV